MNQYELKRMFNYRRVWATCGICGIDHTGRGEMCLACEEALSLHPIKEVDGQGQTIEEDV